MRRFRLTVEDQTYAIEIPAPHERPLRVLVEGDEFIVQIEETDGAPAAPPLPRSTGEAALTKLGAAYSPPSDGHRIVHSPLPGTVTHIVAHVGQAVAHGDELLTIEAMKMLNVIRATSAGTVASIHVTDGAQVSHGDALITLASN